MGEDDGGVGWDVDKEEIGGSAGGMDWVRSNCRVRLG